MSLDHPDPPNGKRRPWDEVLADFAARTGRPLWPVKRATGSEVSGRRMSTAQKEAIHRLWADGYTCGQICRQLQISEDTAYRYRAAS